MNSAIDLRPLTSAEQPKALALWQSVFTETPGFFERYFVPNADPYFRVGDTLGAWVDGRLVSAVHICRRPVHWDGVSLLCGGIANVATLPDFRRQGLSHRLLDMALAKMQSEAFDFSLLGTGVHSHYAALGWEQIGAPRLTIAPFSDLAVESFQWREGQDTEPLALLYAMSPRPAQFERLSAYFQNWAGWALDRASAQIYEAPEHGYLILTDDASDAVRVVEWRAGDAAAETSLLRSAALFANARGKRLELETVPQFCGLDCADTLGTVTLHMEQGAMLRNISLPDDTYQSLLAAYRSGAAVWWMADGF